VRPLSTCNLRVAAVSESLGAPHFRLYRRLGEGSPHHCPSLGELPMLDPMILARIQFAANITFHILFPTISIALGFLRLFF
jgi:hypothetical protein